jgi:hypothetical protein
MAEIYRDAIKKHGGELLISVIEANGIPLAPPFVLVALAI